MIGKFGGKQSLEDAMMYLIVIAGVGFGLTLVGSWIEEDADEQIADITARADADPDGMLTTSNYYEKTYIAKVLIKDVGSWVKLIGVVLLAVGLIMMRTSPSKNT